MTEPDLIAVARSLALLLRDSLVTVERLVAIASPKAEAEAIRLVWLERAERALRDAEALL